MIKRITTPLRDLQEEKINLFKRYPNLKYLEDEIDRILHCPELSSEEKSIAINQLLMKQLKDQAILILDQAWDEALGSPSLWEEEEASFPIDSAKSI